MIDPAYVLSGALVGLLVGLTGVGGGSLMTPLLVLLFGVHPTTAVATDLLFAAATKTVGTAVHGANRAVEWRIALLLAAGSLPGMAVTLGVLAMLGAPGPATQALVARVLGASLVLSGLSLLLRARLLAWTRRRAGGRRVPTAALTIATGWLLGVLVTLSSVGAGAIGATVLLMLYPGLPLVRIVASDIAHAVPLTLLAGAGHVLLGGTDWALLGALLIGSVPAVILGSALSHRMPERALRLLLAAVLLVTGARLLE
jgi:uncharacterized membrane protein YfcA